MSPCGKQDGGERGLGSLVLDSGKFFSFVDGLFNISLFQALDIWGRAKKADERGGKKEGRLRQASFFACLRLP